MKWHAAPILERGLLKENIACAPLRRPFPGQVYCNCGRIQPDNSNGIFRREKNASLPYPQPTSNSRRPLQGNALSRKYWSAAVARRLGWSPQRLPCFRKVASQYWISVISIGVRESTNSRSRSGRFRTCAHPASSSHAFKIAGTPATVSASASGNIFPRWIRLEGASASVRSQLLRIPAPCAPRISMPS
jgi:hypothetical protein